MTGCKPDFRWRHAKGSSGALHRELRALRSIRAALHCDSCAVHPGASMRTMQALISDATSPSWRPPPLGQYSSGQHGGAGFGQTLLPDQRLHRAQAPLRATRTLPRIYTSHPLEKLGCALQRLRAGRGHRQRRAFASAGQHPLMSNAFQTRRQDVLHEPAHKLFARQPHDALGALAVGPSREHHLALSHCLDSLIANRCAMRVAAQVLQHL